MSGKNFGGVTDSRANWQLMVTRLDATVPVMQITPDEVEEISHQLDQTSVEIARLAERVARLAKRIQEARSQPAPEGR